MNSFESIVFDRSYKNPEPKKYTHVSKIAPMPVQPTAMKKTTVFLVLLIIGLAMAISIYVNGIN